MSEIPSPAPERARVRDIATSLIRTWVPIGVGALATWLAATAHWVIPAGASAAVGALAAGSTAGLYYTLARAAERSRRPWVRAIGRWMLGGQVPPEYRVALDSFGRR